MEIIEALHWRYATKRMNGQRVPQEKVDRILEAVCLAPSSYGLQPYSVVVVEDAALRERIKRVAFEQPQITESSHLLVFAAWTPVGAEHVEALMRLTAEKRNLNLADLDRYQTSIKEAVSAFDSPEDMFHWAAKQVYLALGAALTTAAVERVDASPMEGFDPAGLDELLGFRERNLRSVVLMALGYRDEGNDRLAGLEKVRWPRERLVITPFA